MRKMRNSYRSLIQGTSLSELISRDGDVESKMVIINACQKYITCSYGLDYELLTSASEMKAAM